MRSTCADVGMGMTRRDARYLLCMPFTVLVAGFGARLL